MTIPTARRTRRSIASEPPSRSLRTLSTGPVPTEASRATTAIRAGRLRLSRTPITRMAPFGSFRTTSFHRRYRSPSETEGPNAEATPKLAWLARRPPPCVTSSRPPARRVRAAGWQEVRVSRIGSPIPSHSRTVTAIFVLWTTAMAAAQGQTTCTLSGPWFCLQCKNVWQHGDGLEGRRSAHCDDRQRSCGCLAVRPRGVGRVPSGVQFLTIRNGLWA